MKRVIDKINKDMDASMSFVFTINRKYQAMCPVRGNIYLACTVRKTDG